MFVLPSVDDFDVLGNGLEGTDGTDTFVASLCSLVDNSSEGTLASDAGFGWGAVVWVGAEFIAGSCVGAGVDGGALGSEIGVGLSSGVGVGGWTSGLLCIGAAGDLAEVAGAGVDGGVEAVFVGRLAGLVAFVVSLGVRLGSGLR